LLDVLIFELGADRLHFDKHAYVIVDLDREIAECSAYRMLRADLGELLLKGVSDNHDSVRLVYVASLLCSDDRLELLERSRNTARRLC
jgi:hypothetical protein